MSRSVPTLADFLIQIGAGDLSPVVQIPPVSKSLSPVLPNGKGETLTKGSSKAGVLAKGKRTLLYERIQQEIDSLDDQVKELLIEEWPSFSSQVNEGRDLRRRIRIEEQELLHLEMQLMGETSFVTPLLADLQEHAKLSLSYARSTHTVEILHHTLEFSSHISRVSASISAGELPEAVQLLEHLREYLANQQKAIPEWTMDTDAWSAMRRWTSEEELRLEGALLGALEGCFELSTANKDPIKATLVLRKSISAAPTGPSLPILTILQALEQALKLRGASFKLDSQLGRIAKQLLKQFLLPCFDATSKGNDATVSVDWEYENLAGEDGQQVHVARLISHEVASITQAVEPLSRVQRFLGFFATHSGILSDFLSPYAATFTTHLTPAIQSLVINSYLFPYLPSTISQLHSYLDVLSLAASFEADFLQNSGYFSFLPAGRDRDREEARIIRDWIDRVQHHWARKVGDEALKGVREEIRDSDWDAELVTIEIPIEKPPTPPPPPSPKRQPQPHPQSPSTAPHIRTVTPVVAPSPKRNIASLFDGAAVPFSSFTKSESVPRHAESHLQVESPPPPPQAPPPAKTGRKGLGAQRLGGVATAKVPTASTKVPPTRVPAAPSKARATSAEGDKASGDKRSPTTATSTPATTSDSLDRHQDVIAQVHPAPSLTPDPISLNGMVPKSPAVPGKIRSAVSPDPVDAMLAELETTSISEKPVSMAYQKVSKLQPLIVPSTSDVIEDDNFSRISSANSAILGQTLSPQEPSPKLSETKLVTTTDLSENIEKELVSPLSPTPSLQPAALILEDATATEEDIPSTTPVAVERIRSPGDSEEIATVIERETHHVNEPRSEESPSNRQVEETDLRAFISQSPIKIQSSVEPTSGDIQSASPYPPTAIGDVPESVALEGLQENPTVAPSESERSFEAIALASQVKDDVSPMEISRSPPVPLERQEAPKSREITDTSSVPMLSPESVNKSASLPARVLPPPSKISSPPQIEAPVTSSIPLPPNTIVSKTAVAKDIQAPDPSPTRITSPPNKFERKSASTSSSSSTNVPPPRAAEQVPTQALYPPARILSPPLTLKDAPVRVLSPPAGSNSTKPGKLGISARVISPSSRMIEPTSPRAPSIHSPSMPMSPGARVAAAPAKVLTAPLRGAHTTNPGITAPNVIIIPTNVTSTSKVALPQSRVIPPRKASTFSTLHKSIPTHVSNPADVAAITPQQPFKAPALVSRPASIPIPAQKEEDVLDEDEVDPWGLGDLSLGSSPSATAASQFYVSPPYHQSTASTAAITSPIRTYGGSIAGKQVFAEGNLSRVEPFEQKMSQKPSTMTLLRSPPSSKPSTMTLLRSPPSSKPSTMSLLRSPPSSKPSTMSLLRSPPSSTTGLFPSNESEVMGPLEDEWGLDEDFVDEYLPLEDEMPQNSTQAVRGRYDDHARVTPLNSSKTLPPVQASSKPAPSHFPLAPAASSYNEPSLTGVDEEDAWGLDDGLEDDALGEGFDDEVPDVELGRSHRDPSLDEVMGGGEANSWSIDEGIYDDENYDHRDLDMEAGSAGVYSDDMNDQEWPLDDSLSTIVEKPAAEELFKVEKDMPSDSHTSAIRSRKRQSTSNFGDASSLFQDAPEENAFSLSMSPTFGTDNEFSPIIVPAGEHNFAAESHTAKAEPSGTRAADQSKPHRSSDAHQPHQNDSHEVHKGAGVASIGGGPYGSIPIKQEEDDHEDWNLNVPEVDHKLTVDGSTLEAMESQPDSSKVGRSPTTSQQKTEVDEPTISKHIKRESSEEDWNFDEENNNPTPLFPSGGAVRGEIESGEMAPMEHSPQIQDASGDWGWGVDEEIEPIAVPTIQSDVTERSAVKDLLKETGSTLSVKSTTVHSPTSRTEQMLISRHCRSIVKIASGILRDALEVGDPRFPHPAFAGSAPHLLNTLVSILSFYRATAPVHHSVALRSKPAISMQFANDTMWIGEEVEALWSNITQGQNARLLEGSTKVEGAVKLTKRMAVEWREKAITIQQDNLMLMLDEAKHFLYTEDDAHFVICETALLQIVKTIEDLAQAWNPVMNPTARYAVLGGLIESVLIRVLTEIEDQTDISEEESIRLNKLCKILHGLEGVFASSFTSVGREVSVWFKFVFLSELLEASMADILFLFDNGHLVDFSTSEIAKLVRALFSDSPLRARNVEHIMKGHPELRDGAVGDEEEDTERDRDGWH